MMSLRRTFPLLLVFGASCQSSASHSPAGHSPATAQAPAPSISTLSLNAGWPTPQCQQKVASLMSEMTVNEKAGQLVQTWQASATPEQAAEHGLGALFSGGDSAAGATGYDDRGKTDAASWAAMLDAYHSAARQSRLGIPLIYGMDAVHGNSKTAGATIFPHNIGLGCAGDEQLAERVGRATAEEVSAIGVNWVYGPSSTAAADERWGRFFESYSESPVQVGLLAAATTRGLQGATSGGQASVVACAKHFAGDGITQLGTSTAKPEWTDRHGILDRGDVRMNEAQFRQVAIDHYRPIVKAGVGSIMASFSSWNGDKTHGNAHLLTEILKGELGFEGFVTGDYRGHEDLAGDYRQQVLSAINAGVDMIMEPEKWQQALQIVQQEAGAGLPMARVDDAVRRILTVKCEAGLFERRRDPNWMSTVGSPEHRQLARQAVRQSAVLLKNDSPADTKPVLPLPKGSKLYLTGSGADDLTRQCGGWTISWQGSGAETTGTTLKQALAKGATLVDSLDEADTAIVVLAEEPYAEWFGDDPDIELPEADLQALRAVRSSGKPTVAVLFSGRPMILEPHLELADAWIAAWLPGSEGDGLADVLFGDYAPTGKLSHSWPRSVDQLPLWPTDPGYDPLFEYGFGLTYASAHQ